RPTWDKSSYQPLNLHKSFSDSDLSDPLGSSVSDASEEELVFEGNGSDAGSSSFAKQQIEKMWDGFSLEDYISRAKHSLPSSPACRKVHKKQKVWSPRVTVPKPFQMTIREAQRKEQNVKSKSQIELENHLLKKQLEEEAECQKKFRANPVPAAVFLPLYHDIVQRNEERRRSVRERSKLKLLASQKPFKFIERERQRSESRKMLLKDVPPPENKPKVFRAKPVPKCVYSPDFNDKLKKEELYREIRIRMRAEELLRNSSVPNSRLALKGTNNKQKHKSTEPKRTEHKPKIKSSVPDFELLHEKFQKRLLQQKKVRHLTVCEPFDLCTSYIPSKKGKILKDIQEDEEKLKETRWPFASPRRKPQMGQAGANSHLLGGGKSKSPKSTESTRRRLEALRNNEKQRRQEYLQELQEMEERVKQMPLLFERVTQKNARIAAEKYYSKRLRALGICPEFVSKKGGAAKSLQFSPAGDFTPIAVRERIIRVKVKKKESFEEAAGDKPQSEQSWEEEEEEEKGKGVKTSSPGEQCSDLEDGDEARASPDVLEPESSRHSDDEEHEEEEAKSGPSLGCSQEEEEDEEEEEAAKADLALGYSQEAEEEEEEEEEEEAEAGPSLDQSQDEEEEAKAGPSRGQSQEEEEEEDESRASSRSDRSHEHEEEAQSEPEAEGAFQYEDEEYESDGSEEKPSDEEGD
ncbi:F161A protein, partial [Nicator chloris]|nr:F161A protein [Nicator chloris]